MQRARAGVWRAKAIRAAGGWNSRTTVEDMDLSLRAYMAGWAGVYLSDVTVLNEARAPGRAARPETGAAERPCYAQRPCALPHVTMGSARL
jgi:hypothetical protein